MLDEFDVMSKSEREMLDNIESQKSDEQKRLDSHWEEIQMEFEMEQEELRREPYEVVEETHRRASGSRYKVIKILERRTRKVIGFKYVELKPHGQSNE